MESFIKSKKKSCYSNETVSATHILTQHHELAINNNGELYLSADLKGKSILGIFPSELGS